MTIDDEVKQIAASVAEPQKRLSGLSKLDPSREAVKTELASLLATLASRKEEAKRPATLRNLAGLTSPFALACAERFDAETISALEVRALEIQTEREQAAAARRAAKAAPPPPPKPALKGPPKALTATQRAAVQLVRRRPPASGNSP